MSWDRAAVLHDLGRVPAEAGPRSDAPDRQAGRATTLGSVPRRADSKETRGVR